MISSSGNTTLATANTWSTSAASKTSGCVDLASNSLATFYITGVQLETGTVATTFEYRPYGTELALCQRYFASFVSLIIDSSAAVYNFPLPVTMRATPTFTGGNAGFATTGYTNGNTSGYMSQTTRAVNSLVTASAEL